jgi:GNAT superfamily N-acetyltransferase
MVALGDVALREAELDDWPAIGAVMGRTPEEAAGIRQQLQREFDPWIAFVAESALAPAAPTPATRIVGVVVCGVPRARRTDDLAKETVDGSSDRAAEARVLWLEVLPSVRRHRVGTRLLEFALDKLRARQFGRAALLVDAGQFEALALFRKAGFGTDRESIALTLPPAAGAAIAGSVPSAAAQAVVRPLALDDVPHLAGLLIELGIERAEAAHDELPALTPNELSDWLQRISTVAVGAWEARDPEVPLGLAWASQRQDDAILRFVAVHDDARRRGTGRALVGALLEATRRPATKAPAAAFRPLRAQVIDPADVLPFFRALGFESEGTTFEMSRAL